MQIEFLTGIDVLNQLSLANDLSQTERINQGDYKQIQAQNDWYLWLLRTK